MHLAPTRFIKIDGTAVTATVNSAADAKVAIKEIRQKKREYMHIRRGLIRDRKAAEKIANASKRNARRKAPEGLLSRVGSALSTVASVAGAYGTASAKMDLPRIEQECSETEEILHNLDTVLIQIEGKLLHLS